MSPSAAMNPPVDSQDDIALLAKEEKSLKSSTTSLSLEDNPNIHLSSHPVLFHKITCLRSEKTPPGTFRSLLRQVTYHLGYEATKNLSVRTGLHVTVPLGKEDHDDDDDIQNNAVGVKLASRIAMIPILRSGLGMTDAMLELLPNAAVHHIGMYRTPGSQTPVQYFNRLPRGKCRSDVAYILDPIIGSGATVMSVISILKKWGVPKIHVITVVGSQTGLELLAKTHPEISVTVGMIDKGLTASGLVLPGLGDVGDRLFGLGNYDFLDGVAEDPVAVAAASSGASACSDDTQRAAKRHRSASLELEMEHNGTL